MGGISRKEVKRFRQGSGKCSDFELVVVGVICFIVGGRSVTEK